MTNEEQATWLGEAVQSSLETAQCLMNLVGCRIRRIDLDAGGIGEAIGLLRNADLALRNARGLAEHLEADDDD